MTRNLNDRLNNFVNKNPPERNRRALKLASKLIKVSTKDLMNYGKENQGLLSGGLAQSLAYMKGAKIRYFEGDHAGSFITVKNKEECKFIGDYAGSYASFEGTEAGENSMFLGYSAGEGASFEGTKAGINAVFRGKFSGRITSFKGCFAGYNFFLSII